MASRECGSCTNDSADRQRLTKTQLEPLQGFCQPKRRYQSIRLQLGINADWIHSPSAWTLHVFPPNFASASCARKSRAPPEILQKASQSCHISHSHVFGSLHALPCDEKCPNRLSADMGRTVAMLNDERKSCVYLDSTVGLFTQRY